MAFLIKSKTFMDSEATLFNDNGLRLLLDSTMRMTQSEIIGNAAYQRNPMLSKARDRYWNTAEGTVDQTSALLFRLFTWTDIN